MCLHAESAAEHEPFDASSGFGKALRRIEERGRVCEIGIRLANLRAEMCVQPGEAQLWVRPQYRKRRCFVTRVDPELRVLAARPYEGVRSGFDAHVQAQNDAGAASVAREICQRLKFFDPVNDDVTDPAAACGVQFFACLAGAVQR